jgi:hypothetical protein
VGRAGQALDHRGGLLVVRGLAQDGPVRRDDHGVGHQHAEGAAEIERAHGVELRGRHPLQVGVRRLARPCRLVDVGRPRHERHAQPRDHLAPPW